MSPVVRSAMKDPTRPHVALAVEDIEEARQELDVRGISYLQIKGLVGDNSDQVFVQDSFGNTAVARSLPTLQGNAENR